MLSAALAIAQQEGWLTSDAASAASIHLSLGATVSAVVRNRRQTRCFLKFSEQQDLSLEAHRSSAAHTAFPQHAPRCLGFRATGQLSVLATEALRSDAISATFLSSARNARQFGNQLVNFFAQCKRSAKLAESLVGETAMNIDTVLAYFQECPTGAEAFHCLKDARADVEAWKHHPQHCDFVLNNLAINDEGNLVVYDWEDYGTFGILGLDLFTMEFSLARQLGIPFALSHECLSLPGLPIGECCRALELDLTAYRKLRPAYAALFRFVKRVYGPGIQHLLDDLLRHSCS